MNSEVEITLRIERIRHIFQAAQAFAEQEDDQFKLAAFCNNKEPEFRSIAFEAVAMALATKDFAAGGPLSKWSKFSNGPAKAHSAQVHAGLGWAAARQRVLSLSFNEVPDPLHLNRVLDGYGYYDGLFRQRQSITGQVVPDHIDDLYQKGYDQGIGRSLWYIAKGSIDKLLSLVLPFPPYRQPDIWRGIGIACSYVGGCDEDTLYDLSSSAGICRTQLAIGSLLVASARHTAGAPTPDSELACKVWCNYSAEEAATLIQSLQSPVSTTHPPTLPEWLLQIENHLHSGQLTGSL